MSSRATDPQEVVKILCAVASDQDVGNSLSRVIHKAIGEDTSTNSVKVLAADLVHLGSIDDKDWDIVTTAIKTRLNSQDSDSQIFALNLIPSIPPQYLVTLMMKDGLGSFMLTCCNDANPSVRCATVCAFGYLLTQPSIIQTLAEKPNEGKSCLEYWQRICDGTIDAENQISGTAFNAIKVLMQLFLSFSTKAASPSSILVCYWHSHCIQTLRKNLSSLLYRAQELDPDGLVAAIEVVFLLGKLSLRDNEDDREAKNDSGLWTIPIIVNFLEKQMSAIDIAVVSKASIFLLQFCESAAKETSKSWGLASSVSLSLLSFKAITALENLWDSKEAVPVYADIALAISYHLKQLELVDIGEFSGRLLQRISLLPNPKDRIDALMHLWRTVLDADLKLRKLRHSRGNVVPGASLQNMMESPFFSGVVAGHQKQQSDLHLTRAIQKASYPAYKQELVCSLMKVVMNHSKSFDFAALFPEKSEEAKEHTLESAVQSDIQTDVYDWFATSVVALYLTQACLGWDNLVNEGFHGLTLPSDLWLQQLQLTSQILCVILNHFNIQSFSELRALNEESNKTRTGKLLKTFAGEAFEIQKLMKRMVFFWSFISDALKPRVFWIVCHHIELPDRVDDIWTHLRDGLKDLMITRPTELSKRQQKEQIQAAKDGQLASETHTVYNLKASPDPKNPAIGVDQSEVSLEGLTVGLVCLGLLKETLMNQYSYERFPYYYDHVRDIANLLKDVCNQILEESTLTVDMFNQCQSISKELENLTQTKPVNYESVQLEKKETEKSHDPDQSVSYLYEDLSTKVHEGYPFSNSKSLAYMITKNSRRYKTLHKQLYKDHHPDDLLLQTKTEVPPVPENPSSIDLATISGELNSKDNTSRWNILTGQGDPVELTMCHELDPFRRILALMIKAENKIGSDITGLVVSFAIEGPVATYREGMISWNPELHANEPVMHEVQLGLIQFGSIEIQPFMDISLQGQERDFPSLSCATYSIPLVDLLIPMSMDISPKAYFQEMCSWPDSVNMTAVCRWPGTNGGMRLLSALNKTKLKKIWPKKRNSLSFFQAIYLIQTFNESLVSLSITGQLVDLKEIGLAAWAVTPEDEQESGNMGYYLCKCTIASNSPRVITEVRSKTAELLAGFSDGGLIPGLDPGVGRPPVPPPIHPDVHVEVKTSEELSYTVDLPTLGLQEWKRLNKKT